MTSVTTIDNNSIGNISFVPTDEEIQKLYEISKLAQDDLSNNVRTPLLSKLYKLPGNIGLCPETLNPNDTVLASMGSGRHVEGALWKPGKGGDIGNKDIITAINDKYMPFAGGSNGPNIVLTDCQELYGKNRINLFHCNEEETKKLAIDMLKFRNNHLENIFNLFVVHMCNTDFTDNFKLDPTKDEQLDTTLRNDYTNVCNMFKKVMECVSSFTTTITIDRLRSLMESNVIEKKKFPFIYTLEECGMKCTSFCQTWLRSGSDVGNAQFSVMSPHFQTRFYIYDEDKIKTIAGVNNTELQSYTKLITQFDKIMEKDYGIGGGGQSFINVDKLFSKDIETKTTQCESRSCILQ